MISFVAYMECYFLPALFIAYFSALFPKNIYFDYFLFLSSLIWAKKRKEKEKYCLKLNPLAEAGKILEMDRTIIQLLQFLAKLVLSYRF